MPDAPKPVTVGDLKVYGPPTSDFNGLLGQNVTSRDVRPATVADLMSPEIRPLVVSALREEGVLVIETESTPDGGGSDHVGIYYPRWACDALEKLIKERGCKSMQRPYVRRPKDGDIGSEEILDALAEAQP